ncbi:hypothetical protein DOY81_006740 [Sarcophaga bullata]|nr:hypothetical protein DOY81_006740 [Sarcophaga bullata]
MCVYVCMHVCLYFNLNNINTSSKLHIIYNPQEQQTYQVNKNHHLLYRK